MVGCYVKFIVATEQDTSINVDVMFQVLYDPPVGIVFTRMHLREHLRIVLCKQLPQPLLSDLMGESFTLRHQKLDSEVDGWF